MIVFRFSYKKLNNRCFRDSHPWTVSMRLPSNSSKEIAPEGSPRRLLHVSYTATSPRRSFLPLYQQSLQSQRGLLRWGDRLNFRVKYDIGTLILPAGRETVEPGSTNRPALANMLMPRQVHTITDRFAMANTYLIDGEQLIVVDPGSELHVHLLCDYVEHILHRSLLEIQLVVLTHLHLDHTSGLDALLRRCHATVAASSVVRTLARRPCDRLPSLSRLTEQVRPRVLDQFDLFLPAYERQMRYITLWLEDVEGLPVDANWRVIASPGHTPDSLCLYNPFTAELLSGDSVITVERGRPLARGRTSPAMLRETINVLRSLRVFFLYPGHGWPVLARDPLKNVRIEW